MKKLPGCISTTVREISLKKTGTNFNTVSEGSVNFLDVDGNNTLDLLITGNKAPTGLPPFQPVTALYLNDGSGNFTEKTGSGFANLHSSSVAVADIDGNSTPDVIMSELKVPFFPAANVYQSIVYFNDGTNNCTKAKSHSFSGILDGGCF
ncbi:MAG: VCBS repeat-containing protein [Bacteroidia bacterium]